MNVDVGLSVSFFNNATNGLRSLSGDIKNVGENAQATHNRLKAIQVVIAGILIDKTLEWGKALVKAAAATQNLDIRLAAFAGGAEKAHQIVNKLSQDFGATGFSMDGLTNSWTKLRAAFTTNDDATKVLEAIVNDVGAMGGKDENIDNLAAAFQRMFSTGLASAREYKTIIQQTGLTLGDLAKAAGTSSQAFSTSLQRGFMSAHSFIDAFVKASQDRFSFFANDLKNSVGGAFKLLDTTWSKAMSDLGERTNINAHLTVFFQNLAKEITKVMGAISQKDIDHFFEWLQKMEPLIRNIITGVSNMAIAVLKLAGVIGSILGMMSPEMIEWGFIGYLLFGKKGALVFALLGGVVNKMSSVSGQVAAAEGNLQKKAAAAGTTEFGALKEHYEQGGFFNRMFAPERAALDVMYGKIFGAWKDGGDAIAPIVDKITNISGAKGSLFGSPADIKAMQDAIDKMMADFAKGGVGGTKGGGVISNQMLDAIRAAMQLTQQLKDTFDQIGDHIKQIDFKTAGDELGASLQTIKLEGDGMLKAIDGAIKSEAMLNIHTAANLALVKALKAERAEIEKSIERALQKEREVYALNQKAFVLAQVQQQAQTAFNTQMLSRQTSIQGMGWWQQALLGTDGGAAVTDFMQQEETYKESIANIDAQILQLEIQLRDVQADPAKVAAIKATEASLEKLKGATQAALGQLSVEGTLLNKLWTTFGNTIENDVADGITGLLEGTQTLGDVARKVFSDMISMAVKYLVQLLAIKAIGLLGFADGGIMPGGVAPFANGGPIQPGGNVKAFANGDILTGPTMFGLAGEAGTEAIMPLTRIGGKLGVRSEGGGGGSTHVHIHAIDTQSGMDFLMKNADGIVSMIEMKRRLNRGAKG